MSSYVITRWKFIRTYPHCHCSLTVCISLSQLAPEWKSVLRTIEQMDNNAAPGPRPLPISFQSEVVGGQTAMLVDVYFPGYMFNGATGNGDTDLHRDYDPAAAALKDWQACLAEVCGDSAGGIPVLRESRIQLLAKIPTDCLSEALQWLSAQRPVHWLAPRADVKTSNYQGITILQTGRAAPSDRGNLIGLRPLWAAGLNGTGQIIGCGDSGIGTE